MFKSLLTLILIAAAVVNCAGQSSPRVANARQGQEQALSTILDQVSDLEDPLLRVFLRHEIANALWESGSSNDAAAAVSADALADINANGESLPASLMKSYRRSLFAKLRQHAPSVAAEMADRYGAENATPRGEIESAYEMLNTQGGVGPAVERVRKVIRGGQDPGNRIVFFLVLLEQKSPETVSQILSDILAGEEARPGTLSIRTLFSLNHLYLGKQVPAEVQNRHLAVLVSAVRLRLKMQQWTDTEEMVNAYGLLLGALPVIEKQFPALLSAATEQSVSLGVRLPAGELERMLADDRIERSPDPFRQLLNEIEAAKDKGVKEGLTTRAARMALQRGMPGTALDLALKIKPEDDGKTLWRDQFIERIAVAANDAELMTKAVESIRSPLVRSSALQRVALRQKETKSLDEARGTLHKAFIIIDKSAGGTDKAVALSEIALTYGKLDPEGVPEVARAFVAAVNLLPADGRTAARPNGAGEAQPHDLPMVVKGANALFRFAATNTQDESEVIRIAEGIKRQDIKTTAIVSASLGLLGKSKHSQTAAGRRD